MNRRYYQKVQKTAGVTGECSYGCKQLSHGVNLASGQRVFQLFRSMLCVVHECKAAPSSFNLRDLQLFIKLQQTESNGGRWRQRCNNAISPNLGLLFCKTSEIFQTQVIKAENMDFCKTSGNATHKWSLKRHKQVPNLTKESCPRGLWFKIR